ncbi:hypothetical protein GLOIN_2v1727698, partial [Rhizophagus irregularis DAOM 181602=DAOM 197198]
SHHSILYPITPLYLPSCPISPFCFLSLLTALFTPFHLLLLSITPLLFHHLSPYHCNLLIFIVIYCYCLNTVVFFF